MGGAKSWQSRNIWNSTFLRGHGGGHSGGHSFGHSHSGRHWYSTSRRRYSELRRRYVPVYRGHEYHPGPEYHRVYHQGDYPVVTCAGGVLSRVRLAEPKTSNLAEPFVLVARLPWLYAVTCLLLTSAATACGAWMLRYVRIRTCGLHAREPLLQS